MYETYIPKHPSQIYQSSSICKTPNQINQLNQINSDLQEIAHRDSDVKTSIELLKQKLKITTSIEDFDVSYSSISMTEMCGNCNLLKKRLQSIKNMTNPLKEEMKIMALKNAKLTRQNKKLNEKIVQLEEESSQRRKQQQNEHDRDGKLLIELKMKDMQCTGLLKQNRALALSAQKLKEQVKQLKREVQSVIGLKQSMKLRQSVQLQNTVKMYLTMIKQKDQEFQKEKKKFQQHLQQQQLQFKKVHNSQMQLSDELKRQIEEKQNVIELINKSVNSNQFKENHDNKILIEKLRAKEIQCEKMESLNQQVISQVNTLRNDNMYMHQMIGNYQIQLMHQSQKIKDLQLRINGQKSRQKQQILQQFQLLKQQLTNSHKIQDQYIAKIQQLESFYHDQLTVNEGLRKNLKIIQEQKNRLIGENNVIRQEIDQLAGRVKNAEYQKEILQRQLMKSNNRIKELNQIINLKHIELTQLQHKLNTYQTSSTNAQKSFNMEISVLSKQLSALRKQLQQKNDQITQLAQLLDTRQTEFTQEKQSLVKQLSKISDQLVNSQSQSSNQQLTIKKLTEQLQLIRQLHIKQKKDLEEMQHQREQSEQMIKLIEQQKKLLTFNLSQQKQHSQQLIQQLHSYKENMTRLQQQKSVFQHQKQIYQSQIQLLKGSLKSSSQSKQLQYQHLHKIEKLNSQLTATTSKCQFIEGINEELKKQITHKQNELNQTNTHVESLLKIKEEISIRLREKENEINQLMRENEERIHNFMRERDNLVDKDQFLKIKSQAEIINSELSQAVKVNTRLNINNTELNKEYTELNQSHIKLVTNLKQKQQQLVDWAFKNNQLTQTISQLTNNLSSQQQSITSLTQHNTHITHQLNQLSQSLNLTRIQLSTAQARLSQTQALLKQTQLALSSTQQQLAQNNKELTESKRKVKQLEGELQISEKKFQQAELQFDSKYFQLKVKAQALQEQLNFKNQTTPHTPQFVSQVHFTTSQHHFQCTSQPHTSQKSHSQLLHLQQFKQSLQQRLQQCQLLHIHELQNKQKELQSIRQQLQTCIKQKNSIFTKSNQLIQQLQVELKRQKDGNAKLEHEVFLMKENNYMLENQLKMQENQLKQQENQLKQQEDKLKAMNEDKMKLFEDNKNLFNDNIKQTEQITLLQQQLQSAQHQLALSRSSTNSPIKLIKEDPQTPFLPFQQQLSQQTKQQLSIQIQNLTQQNKKLLNKYNTAKQQYKKISAQYVAQQQEMEVMNQMFVHMAEEVKLLKEEKLLLHQQKAQLQVYIQLLNKAQSQNMIQRQEQIRNQLEKAQAQQKQQVENLKLILKDQKQRLDNLTQQLQTKQAFLNQRQHLINQKQSSLQAKHLQLEHLQNKLNQRLHDIEGRSLSLADRQARFTENQSYVEETLLNAKRMLEIIEKKSIKIQKIKQKKKLQQQTKKGPEINSERQDKSQPQQSQQKAQQPLPQQLAHQQPQPQLHTQQPQPNEQQQQLKQDLINIQTKISHFLSNSKKEREDRTSIWKNIESEEIVNGEYIKDREELIQLIDSLRQPTRKASTGSVQFIAKEGDCSIYFAEIESFIMRKYEEIKSFSNQHMNQVVLLLSQILQSYKLIISTKSQSGLKQLTKDIKSNLQKLFSSLITFDPSPNTYTQPQPVFLKEQFFIGPIQKLNQQKSLQRNSSMQFKKKKYPPTAQKNKQSFSELYSDRKPAEKFELPDDYQKSESLNNNNEPNEFIEDDDVVESKRKQKSILLVEDIDQAVSFDEDETNLNNNQSSAHFSLKASSGKGSITNQPSNLLLQSKQLERSFDFTTSQKGTHTNEVKDYHTEASNILLSERSTMSRKEMEDRYKTNIKNSKLASKLKNKKRR